MNRPSHHEPAYWALDLDVLQAVVVLEITQPDQPPSVHLAVRVVVHRTVDRLLRDNGWRATDWAYRSWGRISLVSIAPHGTAS